MIDLLDTNAWIAYLRQNNARLVQRSKWTPIGPNDLMIASIARIHGLTLVTHNTKEFSDVVGQVLTRFDLADAASCLEYEPRWR